MRAVIHFLPASPPEPQTAVEVSLLAPFLKGAEFFKKAIIVYPGLVFLIFFGRLDKNIIKKKSLGKVSHLKGSLPTTTLCYYDVFKI